MILLHTKAVVAQFFTIGVGRGNMDIIFFRKYPKLALFSIVCFFNRFSFLKTSIWKKKWLLRLCQHWAFWDINGKQNGCQNDIYWQILLWRLVFSFQNNNQSRCYYFMNTIPWNIKNNISYQYGGKNQDGRQTIKIEAKLMNCIINALI